MDFSGRAFRLALKHSFWGLVFVLALLSAGVVAIFLGHLIAAISGGLVALWLAATFLIFFLYRDPTPALPFGLPKAMVAPSHGQVTDVAQSSEPGIISGVCQKVSINLSWRDVHLCRSPLEGVVTCCQETTATNSGAGSSPAPQLLLTLAPREVPTETVGVRMVAGRFPRRIEVWTRTGEVLERGQRLAMRQFGSRCELILPLSAEVQVKPGDRVRGGETIVACFP